MQEEGQERGIGIRTYLVGIVLSLMTIWIVSYAELVTGKIMIGFLQMPPVVIVLTFFLVLANKLLQRFCKKRLFTIREFPILFTMMLLTSMIVSRGLLEHLHPTLTSPRYFANSWNRWGEFYYPHIRSYTVPWDPHSGEAAPPQHVREFYEKAEAVRALAASRTRSALETCVTGWKSIPFREWAAPLGFWLAFFALIYGAMYCMSALMYRQWATNERLNFPLVQLPFEMVRDDSPESFWRRPAMWVGFGLMAVIYTIRGLHANFPAFPDVPIQWNVGQFLSGSGNWAAIGNTPLYWAFAAIGFFYLLPKSVLFSLWFFWLLCRVQLVAGASLGFTQTKGFVDSQTAGAYFILVLTWLWLGRTHWLRVLRAAFGSVEARDDSAAVPYGLAFWGLWLCFAGIVWLAWIIGMSLLLAILTFGMFLFVFSFVMARSTAESGMLMTEGPGLGTPDAIVGVFVPPETLGSSNLTAIAFFKTIFWRDLRGLVLTGFLDAQKLADDAGTHRRKLAPAVFGILLFAFVVGSALHLYLPYTHGGNNLYGYVYRGEPKWHFTHYAYVLKSGGLPRDNTALWGMITGCALTVFVSFMRTRFFWWPLHPLGIALAHCWTTTVFWWPIFLAWLIKHYITRYGGNRLYRTCRPFFLGLIFGEFFMGVFWTCMTMFFEIASPVFPWP